MSDTLGRVDNGYTAGMVSVDRLLEGWQPRDEGRYETYKELIAEGDLRGALRMHEKGLREGVVTDDLPTLMTAGTDTYVRKAYENVSQPWRSCFPIVDFSNFHEKTIALYGPLSVDDKAGNAAANGYLPIVPEGHGFDEMYLGETSISAQLKTYGAAFTVSRQALINDDKRALSNSPQLAGARAAKTLNKIVADVLNDASTDLFDTDNTDASAGALTITTLEEQVQEFVDQNGEGLAPRYMIVPAGISITAANLLNIGALIGGTTVARPAGSVVGNMLELVVLPGLTVSDTYFLAADPSAYPTIEVAGLNGSVDPALFVQQVPDMRAADGTIYKVRFDATAYFVGRLGIRKVEVS